jgi:hypothetical protein
MSNNLKILEKELRAIAKRCKDVRYTRGLLFCFLFMRMLPVGASTFSGRNSKNSIEQARRELNTSINDIKILFKQSRAENNKLIRNANMELIKLMEEGDHIVKSPWSSWQFGTIYSYNDWRKPYKGRGDRNLYYIFESKLSQGEWYERYANPKDGYMYSSLIDRNRDPFSSLTSKRDNMTLNTYGLMELNLLPEDVVKVTVSAGITPKEVTRIPEANPPTVPKINAPSLNYNSPSPVKIKSRRPNIFNIDLGSYCNDMTSCGKEDETMKGLIDDYNTAYPGSLVPLPQEYAGYQLKDERAENVPDPNRGWDSIIGETINASDSGLPGGNHASLRYSWNIADNDQAYGQWRLFRIFYDVMSSPAGTDPHGNPLPLATSDFTIDKNLTISSENDVDSMYPGFTANENNKNRQFNTQKFLIGGSRVATLDNAEGGGKITNAATLNLRGPLTVGLEVQYDALGNKERTLINSGKITDENESASNPGSSLIKGMAPGNRELLDLGLYNWKKWESIHNMDGAPWEFEELKTTPYSSSEKEGTGGSLSVYRNSRGYLGAKVGMILTREDGEYHNYGIFPEGRKTEDKYRIENGTQGKIEFHGNQSIGMQVYSPYASDFGKLVDSNGIDYDTESVPPNVEMYNRGTITTEGTDSYGMKVSSGIDIENSKVENSGTINVSGYKEIENGSDFGKPQTGENGIGASAGMAVLEDPNQDGKVIGRNTAMTTFKTYKYNGTVYKNLSDPNRNIEIEHFGMYNGPSTPKPIRAGKAVKNLGTINVSGIGNMGMFLQTTFDDTFLSSGNININSDSTAGKNNKYNAGMRISTGTVYDHDDTTLSAKYRDSSYNEYDLFQNIARKFPSGTQKGINKGNITINGNIEPEDSEEKSNNAGMIASGGDAVVENITDGAIKGTITISGGKENIGMAVSEGNRGMKTTDRKTGKIRNDGKINITGGKNNIGMYVNEGIDSDPTPDNNTKQGEGLLDTNGEIDLDSSKSTAVVNYGKFESKTGSKITVKGKESIGVYSNKTRRASSEPGSGYETTPETLVRGTINASDGATALFAEKSVITLKDITLNIGEHGLLFYSKSDGSTLTGRLHIGNGNVRANIAKNGIAFYSTIGTVNTVIDTMEPENLNSFLNISMQKDSRLFVLETTNIHNLSSIPAILGGARDLIRTDGRKVGRVTGEGYKYITYKGGTLNIDTPVNLNDPNDRYNVTELISSNVNIMQPIRNNGSAHGNGKNYAVAQSNRDTESGLASDLNITNSSTVELTGQNNMVGIVTERGTITNTSSGTVRNTGENGIGLVGSNSSIVNNQGNVVIGKGGVGLYGINNIQGTTAKGNIDITNSGTISSTGENFYGIIAKNTVSGKTSNITLSAGSQINFGEVSNGIGVYGLNSRIKISGGHISIGNKGVGVFAEGSTIENHNGGGRISMVNDSIGYVLNSSNYINHASYTPSGVQMMGENNIYIYARNGGTVENKMPIFMTGSYNVALYGKDGANLINRADINQGTGLENVGMLLSGRDGSATNYGNITVSKSGILNEGLPNQKKIYSIGMAAKGSNMTLTNEGRINVTSDKSIGMYGNGSNVTVINKRDIIFNASNASPTNRINQMIGMYLENGAIGKNYGHIGTAENYVGRANVGGIIGIVALSGSTFENYGDITIDSDRGIGAYIDGGIIKNYGNITVNGPGASGVAHDNASGINGTIGSHDSDETVNSKINGTGGNVTVNGGTAGRYRNIDNYNPNKPAVGGVALTEINGKLQAVIDGAVQRAHTVNPEVPNPTGNFLFNNVGIYVDTLGRTRMINGNGFKPKGKLDLIFGIEAAQKTNDKVIKVPYQTFKHIVQKLENNPDVENYAVYSGALHWFASWDKKGDKSVTMVKVPYHKYAKDNNTRTYLYGVESRYSMNGLDSREKALFNKLNSIGDNQAILWAQAAEEMIGRQYANTQQRLYKTDSILDDEIRKLSGEWRNFSKKSNKITSFGTRGEYKTETAGIKDYNNNAYGVAFINENETLKPGESSGWYGGIVHNTFRFKDIGKSREKTALAKVGTYKTKVFGKEKNTSWTIAVEGFVSRSEMDRRYLVVDEIFSAKGNYTGYGAAIENEMSKEFRLGEKFFMKPYGGIKIGYGRFETVKEKRGELRLAVKGDDYYSIKPKTGVEFKFRQSFAKKATFVTTLGLGYESELGKVGDINNRLRVNYTDADWYNIRGEKEDRKGNFKSDLNIGIENQRFGVTLNGGYDTKGKNIRGGISLRLIY